MDLEYMVRASAACRSWRNLTNPYVSMRKWQEPARTRFEFEYILKETTKMIKDDDSNAIDENWNIHDDVFELGTSEQCSFCFPYLFIDSFRRIEAVHT